METRTTTCPFTVLTIFSSDQLIPARWTETPSFCFRSPPRTCFSIQSSNHQTLITSLYIFCYLIVSNTVTFIYLFLVYLSRTVVRGTQLHWVPQYIHSFFRAQLKFGERFIGFIGCFLKLTIKLFFDQYSLLRNVNQFWTVRLNGLRKFNFYPP